MDIAVPIVLLSRAVLLITAIQVLLIVLTAAKMHQDGLQISRNTVISEGAPILMGGPQYPVPLLTYTRVLPCR